jgi:hypothetical protein
LTALVSDAAFGLQNLQMTGEHFWPKICKIDWHETAASVLREILKAGADEYLVEVAERRMKLIAKMDQMIADNVLEVDKLKEEIVELKRLARREIARAVIPNGMAGAIYMVCESIKEMLLEKNAAYGNSAAEPVRIFSKADPLEQINVRIDDKLSRLMRGNEYPGDDTELDLIGYLILKRAITNGRKAA